ncbi:MAG: hypothetical protein E7555_06090 [Ruminococcaceae bacterium]|nr:hypothetical protein [Oscillospiraceae bacterium]
MNCYGKNDKTHQRLMEHYMTYPKLQIQDVFKFLHQSAMGCEHIVSSLEKATQYIKDEYDRGIAESKIFVEKLDGDYSRVYLSCMDYGISAEALGEMLFLSAKKEIDGVSKLKEKLKIAEKMIAENLLPFDMDEFRKEVRKWEKEGFPAIHHSQAFRGAYKPAYRVVCDKYAQMISEQIRQKLI